jgi:hypothetical protein
MDLLCFVYFMFCDFISLSISGKMYTLEKMYISTFLTMNSHKVKKCKQWRKCIQHIFGKEESQNLLSMCKSWTSVSSVTFLWHSRIRCRLVPVLFKRTQKAEIQSPKATPNFLSYWGIMEHGVSQGSILWSLLFYIYIYDLPLRTNFISKLIMFVDDMSVINSSRNFGDFCTMSNLILFGMTALLLISWY